MLELKNIYYKTNNNLLYSKSEKTILSDISIKIENGNILGIIGESGAGKTTLAKIIAGILKSTYGEIIYNSIQENDIQILSQNSSDLINPHRKIESLLTDTSSINEILETLKIVGLNQAILPKYGYQLSGGERQRIALVRLLAANPKLLVVDEPFSAQDYESQINLMNLFKELNISQNLTIVCVSHDLEIMKQFPNKLAVMKNGKIIENGSRENIVNNPKEKYTQFLFNASNYLLTDEDFENEL